MTRVEHGRAAVRCVALATILGAANMSVATAQSSSSVGRTAHHAPNWPALILAGPVLVALCMALYAIVLTAAVLLRREAGVIDLVQTVSIRLEGNRVGITLWGSVALVSVAFLGVVLVRFHPLWPIGSLVVCAGLAMLGIAAASAALMLGRRCRPVPDGGVADGAGRFGSGALMLGGCFAVPLIGWICGAVLLLASVGAIWETIIAGGPGRTQQ